MTVEEAADWLHQREGAGISYSLERIEALLDRLGRPDDKPAVIHVAGTNGKGTVCSYLSNIFLGAGLSVGAFETPSFGAVWEQLRYNGEGIAGHQFAETLSAAAPDIEIVEAERGEQVSMFEVMTALAFYTFSTFLPADILILETGMGGRLDATNAVKHPAATIITNVDYDHEAYLGTTIEAITKEKAGIIKRSAPVFTGASEPSLSIIADTAEKIGTFVADLQTFPPEMWLNDLSSAKDRLNAALAAETAVYVCDVLNVAEIEEKSIKHAIRKTSLPGRMEIMQKHPLVIIDTAHNPAAITAVTEKLQEYKKSKTIYVLFAAMKDKKYREMLAILGQTNFAESVYWCSFNDVRAAAPTIEEAQAAGATVSTKNCEALLTEVLANASEEDIVLITGSHAFASQMRHYWERSS